MAEIAPNTARLAVPFPAQRVLIAWLKMGSTRSIRRPRLRWLVLDREVGARLHHHRHSFNGFRKSSFATWSFPFNQDLLSRRFEVQKCAARNSRLSGISPK